MISGCEAGYDFAEQQEEESWRYLLYRSLRRTTIADIFPLADEKHVATKKEHKSKKEGIVKKHVARTCHAACCTRLPSRRGKEQRAVTPTRSSWGSKGNQQKSRVVDGVLKSEGGTNVLGHVDTMRG